MGESDNPDIFAAPEFNKLSNKTSGVRKEKKQYTGMSLKAQIENIKVNQEFTDKDGGKKRR